MTSAPDISSTSKIALNHLEVGIWQWDLPDDLIRGDIVLARLVGLDVATLERGVRLADLERAFHPDDLPAVRRTRQNALGADGAFVLVHRTVPRPGTVRTLLARGRFERDEAGRPTRGRGIVLDVTDEPALACAGSGWFAARGADDLPPIDRIAISVMGARGQVIALPDAPRARLLPHLDGLLGQIGREIAMDSAEPPAR